MGWYTSKKMDFRVSTSKKSRRYFHQHAQSCTHNIIPVQQQCTSCDYWSFCILCDLLFIEEHTKRRKDGNVLLDLIEKQALEPTLVDGLLISQVGFRRLLLAIYIHTSSLVIAAPMAHYIGLNGSRYAYSHSFEYLPIHTLSKYLRGEKIAMHLTKIKKQGRIPFSRAMDYIYRPKAYEDMSPYDFWSQVKICSMSEAKKDGGEMRAFESGHPKESLKVTVLRLKPVVPLIDWTFIGDAKQIAKPLLDNVAVSRPEREIRRTAFLLAKYSKHPKFFGRRKGRRKELS